MVIPTILPRVEEAGELLCLWIISGYIDSFERIAVKTAKAEVFGGGNTVVKLRPDMVNAERQRIPSLRYVAVLARRGRTAPDKFPELLVHADLIATGLLQLQTCLGVGDGQK